MEETTIRRESDISYELWVKDLINDELDRRFGGANQRTFKDVEGNLTTVTEVCRICHEDRPLNEDRYCRDCQDHLDERDNIAKDKKQSFNF